MYKYILCALFITPLFGEKNVPRLTIMQPPEYRRTSADDNLIEKEELYIARTIDWRDYYDQFMLYFIQNSVFSRGGFATLNGHTASWIHALWQKYKKLYHLDGQEYKKFHTEILQDIANIHTTVQDGLQVHIFNEAEKMLVKDLYMHRTELLNRGLDIWFFYKYHDTKGNHYPEIAKNLDPEVQASSWNDADRLALNTMWLFCNEIGPLLRLFIPKDQLSPKSSSS